MLETFFAVLSTLGWIGSLAFLVVYHRSARWWALNYGRALFILGFVTFWFFTSAMLYNLFGPDYPFRTQFRIVNLVLSVAMIYYLLWTLVRGGMAARRTKREHDAEQAEPEL